jgi:uncharacterized membrane protein HdeD (DUF308 family)
MVIVAIGLATIRGFGLDWFKDSFKPMKFSLALAGFCLSIAGNDIILFLKKATVTFACSMMLFGLYFMVRGAFESFYDDQDC